MVTQRPPVIDVKGVCKKYPGKVEALKGVDLQVGAGEIFGLLGPNGAGKSTLLKVLLTIIRPSRCSGVMLGQPIGHKKTLQKVGYLPEHVQFPEYLSGRQVIRYAAGLSGICPKFCKKREEELLEFVGMSAWANRKLRTYSKGMKQRIGLAQALVNDPEIVFLDEPTDGVDPKGRAEMREVLKLLRSQGRTVFINSHLLGELEMVCDSVAILNHGEVVRHGSLSELTGRGEKVVIGIRGHLGAELRSAIRRHLEFSMHKHSIHLETAELERVQPVIDLLREHDVVIESLGKEGQSLESLFLDSVDASNLEKGAGA
ncbi:ABC transporter ATP-binding protein [Rubritalea tangerina]|uniref:ABC transporter ATP-binding protein n=1 Tax=Rubritalea tangerina TaxID=430798 RepID=A0ABW4ZAE4_9BACT